ncbi:protein tyrosine/serine phosphatase [Kribbella voronezhensis]|uniref:Protein tyrosine/serine phosphatase n=1 Tax=Kribbella voronezhensis TaxID=2512212 RepID=A0A4R7T963_9ACTN|nr:tyrosine-protein phosphatase [Kribbella voronezhensis]TDU88494.1 protein tyrosine/serine phosphatase [Kribbella voronezhensis]
MSPHLDWPDCRNVRDLGGLPTDDGGRIRPGVLIRADSLQYLSPAGVDAVRRAGVSRIVDLRSPAEVGESPTPFSQDELGYGVPVQDPAEPGDGLDTIVKVCIDMLDRRPERFAEAVLAIAEAPPGAVVVHCHGGKDRTGMVVALALSVAGVPVEEIVADYFLTKERLASAMAEQLAAEPDESLHAELLEFRDTRAESIVAILDHLDSAYGGPVGYLLHGGLSSARLDVLRRRLTA